MGGADLQRVGSSAQSGQSLLDAAAAGHIEIESPGHCGIWSPAADGSHTGRILLMLVVCSIYSVRSAYEIGRVGENRGLQGVSLRAKISRLSPGCRCMSASSPY